MRCKSVMTAFPAMSLPSTSVSGEALSSYSGDDSPSTSRTNSRLWLGISMPMTDLPAMLSTTRTLSTDSERAKSRDSATIWLALTPGAGSISNRVITGPGCTAVTVMSTLKSFSFFTSSCDMDSSASRE